MINSSVKPQISIIGSGNVATCLTKALQQSGFAINEIYSRSLENANSLSDQIVGSKPVESLNFKQSRSSIFIIAVKDDAITNLVDQIILPDESLVLHTSGVKGLEVFDKPGISFDSGIFYPLQTFNKDLDMSFVDLPIFIESRNPESLPVIKDLVHSLKGHPIQLDHSQKQILHVAAVFASNFTNRMIAASQKILKEADLDKSLLSPLIEQSIKNALKDPDQYLSGPAKRGDLNTIKNHLDILSQNQDLKSIYESITQSILSKLNK